MGESFKNIRRIRPPIRREPAISEYHGVKPVGIYTQITPFCHKFFAKIPYYLGSTQLPFCILQLVEYILLRLNPPICQLAEAGWSKKRFYRSTSWRTSTFFSCTSPFRSASVEE
ncbi:hypothetical protein COS81_04460 [candidate division WWE3 bacterium CG06_land_8_20_14_3_00_42_16]|uniref:Uncharacterized protein n=1 Tax=candidate division WWE3 bacterium CG06_land_8_20_14_3_00_42_16 TaxID=1975083 RepID=A0A2M7ALZ7_UNCKA|nr:MAG: hypothetical protein COS81_04460 [candidate division WWE3 bacterium CG06_land_8_20_14_3_00_42_16]